MAVPAPTYQPQYCNHPHPTYTQQKKTCKWWLKSYCKFGNNCYYDHNFNENGALNSIYYSIINMENRTSELIQKELNILHNKIDKTEETITHKLTIFIEKKIETMQNKLQKTMERNINKTNKSDLNKNKKSIKSNSNDGRNSNNPSELKWTTELNNSLKKLKQSIDNKMEKTNNLIKKTQNNYKDQLKELQKDIQKINTNLSDKPWTSYDENNENNNLNAFKDKLDNIKETIIKENKLSLQEMEKKSKSLLKKINEMKYEISSSLKKDIKGNIDKVTALNINDITSENDANNDMATQTNDIPTPPTQSTTKSELNLMTSIQDLSKSTQQTDNITASTTKSEPNLMTSIQDLSKSTQQTDNITASATKSEPNLMTSIQDLSKSTQQTDNITAYKQNDKTENQTMSSITPLNAECNIKVTAVIHTTSINETLLHKDKSFEDTDDKCNVDNNTENEAIFDHQPALIYFYDETNRGQMKERGKGQLKIYHNKKKNTGNLVFVDIESNQNLLEQCIDGASYCYPAIADLVEWHGYKEARWEIHFYGNTTAAIEFRDIFNQYRKRLKRD